MIRSSVDLPQPDGPISETNSPGAIVEVDARRGRSSAPGRRALKVLPTPLDPDDGRRRRCWRHRRRLGHRRRSGQRSRRPAGPAAQDDELGDADEQKKAIPRSAAGDDRRPELLGPGDVVLVVVDDHPAEAVGDPARALADDRPDDARGRRDLERREQVRQRRRAAQLPEDVAGATRRTSASARAPAGRASAGRGSSRSSPGRTSGRSR